MGMENGVLATLKSYRYPILLLMVVASLTNAIARFYDDSKSFWGVLALQVLFGQAVFNYLRGGWVVLAPPGFAKDANPTARAVLAGFALTVYLFGFAIDSFPRKESVHDRRPNDWTLPTREEIGRSAEKQ